MADCFYLLKLKDALAQQLTSVINIPSVLPILISADCLELEKVGEACFKFADRHARMVLKEDTLRTLHQELLIKLLSRDSFMAEEIDIYEAVLLWMRENNADCSESDSLLRCVRLSEIPAQRLLDLAEPGGFFSERKVLTSLRVQMRRSFEQMNPRGRAGEN